MSGFSRTVIPLIAEPDVYFDAPRWSPDGRTVAVERHRIGAMPEIVLVDVATKSVRIVASDPRTRFTMPAWRPDGAALVVAAAPEEQTFNLVEVTLDGSTMRQLTHTTGGAIWPDVSADGKTIENVPVGQAAPAVEPPRRVITMVGGGKFVVQVGAFAQESNAQQLLGQLNKIGQQAYIDRTELFRVRIGPFPTRDAAIRVRAQLETAGMSAIVVMQ